VSLETGRKPIQPAGFDKAPGLLIKKPEASWALRLPARPGRLKACLKALGLAGPVSNTGLMVGYKATFVLVLAVPEKRVLSIVAVLSAWAERAVLRDSSLNSQRIHTLEPYPHYHVESVV